MRLSTLVTGRFGKTTAGALCATQVLLYTPALARAQDAPAKAETRRENGLSMTIFTTPRGRIAVLLPDDAAPGETVSATLSLARENKKSDQQQQDWQSLMRYSITIGDTTVPVEQGKVAVPLPAVPF